VRTIIGGIEHDGVIGDAEIVQLFEKQADVSIVLHHAIGILILTGDAPKFRFDMYPIRPMV